MEYDNECKAVIITALPLEFKAVCKFLECDMSVPHPKGTKYTQGWFRGKNYRWNILVAEVGKNNPISALETERAISFHKPKVAIFVGVAAGLKDVNLGDVVPATYVCYYESGKWISGSDGKSEFLSRALVQNCSYILKEQSKALQNSIKWLERLSAEDREPEPVINVGPIASGEVVVASKDSDVYKLIKKNHGECIALAMEDFGFLVAVYSNPGVEGLVIRGISDLVEDKIKSDEAGWQPKSVKRAAAFTFELLFNLNLNNFPDHRFPFDLEKYCSRLYRVHFDAHIDDWYVPLDGFLKVDHEQNKKVNLDQFVNSWFEDNSKHHLAILGDYGTGKSWLCLRIAKRLLDQYIKFPDSSPLPLLINFKHYKPNIDLIDLIKIEMFEEYGVKVDDPGRLRQLLNSGKFFLILDGLDEMAKDLGERTALVAYSRLGYVSEIPKVILTCRSHYFYSGSEEREILNPFNNKFHFNTVPEFDLLHIYPLDEKMRIQFVQKRFDEKKAFEVNKMVEATYNLSELCSRPVLLSLFCESYDSLPHFKRALSSIDFYDAYIESWLQRELQHGRLTIDPKEVKIFFEDLAEYMIKNDTLVIDAKSLHKRLADFLRTLNLSHNLLNDIERQLITSTFVKRSVSDGWQFAHRSFAEYFYARKFFRWERETGGSGEFPVRHTPIWQFIAMMALEKWNEEIALFWIQPKIDRKEDKTLSLTTLRAAAAYWLLKKGLKPSSNYPLSGIMLDAVDLNNLDFSNCDLSDADFHSSNLAGANLSCTNLTNAILRDTNFQGANLEGAILIDCDISNANFTEAHFGLVGSRIRSDTIKKLKNCDGFDTANFGLKFNDTRSIEKPDFW